MDDIYDSPIPDDENLRLKKFRDKKNNRQSKPMYKDSIKRIGIVGHGVTLSGADEISQRQKRIDAGLMPNDISNDLPSNGEFYTKQDMIEFANKAIYDYIGSKGMLVNSNLKLPTDWIELNLPKY